MRRLIFQAPFKPFVHRWAKLVEVVGGEADKETKAHLQLLYNVLEAELRETIASREDYIANKVITFEHLWTIFEPGCTIYASTWDRDCGSKFHHGDYFDHPKYGPTFVVYSQVVDWDGDRFGYAMAQKLVLAFKGTMAIADLEAFPLEFHPGENRIRKQLIARGKLFEQYHGYHYQAYKSFAIGKDRCGNDTKVIVDSRIIIDAYVHGQNNPIYVPELTSLKEKPKTALEPSDDDDDDCSSEDSYDFDYEDKNDMAQKALLPLTDLELLHSSARVKGYALKTKRWLEFFVDEIVPVPFDTQAFSSLVLPADQKELILAFATSQIANKDSFDDVISGKGKGIIMLLSGGPGIGKTLTAESVAETMEVPLYMMSAGDLGTRSHEVEASLNKILEMVAKWNAVLLLDECDVFLEARSANDMERNKIVSIFLRTLEYYEGILFLTTNRVKNMDPAFQSRIHITMEYPDLDAAARKQVWMNFLGMSKEGHALTGGDVENLAGIDINGRQIKNVLKTSQLLARHKGVKLGYEHVRTVLNVEKRDLGLD